MDQAAFWAQEEGNFFLDPSRFYIKHVILFHFQKSYG